MRVMRQNYDGESACDTHHLVKRNGHVVRVLDDIQCDRYVIRFVSDW